VRLTVKQFAAVSLEQPERRSVRSEPGREQSSHPRAREPQRGLGLEL
jgi:hypothetical protein